MKYVLLTALLGCAIFASADAADIATLSGRVIDISGGSIGGAVVVLHWNMPRVNGPPKREGADPVVKTDRFGEFSIKLIPGFYDVCVHATGFSPTCQTVALEDGRKQRFNATLKPDPLITNEYGDHFGDDFTATVPTEPSKLPDSIQHPK